MKDEFVSTASHELRTPLTSLRGALGLLDAGVLGPLPPRAGEVVAVARSSAERLARLVSDLLDLEQLRGGKTVRGPAVRLGPLLDSTLAALEPIAAAAGVMVVHAVDGAVLIDGDRLVQVLTNLLANAIRYSPRGATVEVVTRPAGTATRVEVIDHGPGIPERERGRLFGRFVRLDDQQGGSGLGLALSRAIVERHGGRIGVGDTAGGGATFWFELPTAPSMP